MIRFIRNPAPPNTQYKVGMVRDLGALEAAFVSSGDAVDYVPPSLTFPPPSVLATSGGVPNNPLPQLSANQIAGLNAGNVIDSAGAVRALSEAVPPVPMTATGTAYTGAHEFRGIKVRALVGGPQTATIYDNTSATGTPIDTVVFNALETFDWDRKSDLLPGNGGRRIGATGIHIVFSGGTSRTVDVMVGAA